jgi:hypothetical protein
MQLTRGSARRGDHCREKVARVLVRLDHGCQLHRKRESQRHVTTVKLCVTDCVRRCARLHLITGDRMAVHGRLDRRCSEEYVSVSCEKSIRIEVADGGHSKLDEVQRLPWQFR